MKDCCQSQSKEQGCCKNTKKMTGKGFLLLFSMMVTVFAISFLVVYLF